MAAFKRALIFSRAQMIKGLTCNLLQTFQTPNTTSKNDIIYKTKQLCTI